MARKKLEGNDLIISLANKLVKAVNDQDKRVMRQDMDTGHFDVWIHNYGTKNAFIEVCGILEGWSFKGKPIKKIF